MKFINIIGALVLTLFITIGSVNANTPTSEINELNFQLVKEVKRNVESPLLSFSDKNLLGVAIVTVEIAENGKINFASVKSENSYLKRNIERKLEDLNLWTDPKQNGKVFVYTINYKER